MEGRVKDNTGAKERNLREGVNRKDGSAWLTDDYQSLQTCQKRYSKHKSICRGREMFFMYFMNIICFLVLLRKIVTFWLAQPYN